MNNIKIATRTFIKLYDEVADQLEKYYSQDRQFDCGEFSSDHYEEEHEKEYNRILSMIAQKFGVYAKDIENTYEQWIPF